MKKEKEIFLCPYCGEDRNKKMNKKLKRLIQKEGLISEDVNPGGRSLTFKHKGTIQLKDDCNACSHKKLTIFLEGDNNNDKNKT
jgi:predicted metalloprotease